MDVLEALRGRQSVKSYLPRAVEEEKLYRVLEAGRLAPSAMNAQDRKVIVVRDGALKERMVAEAGAQPMVGQAPVLLVLCATKPDFVMPCGETAYPIDLALMGAYMMLEAYEQGLGTCWLGAFSQETVREILGIPPQLRVVTMIPLGYHDGSEPRRERKPLEEILCWDSYQ